MYLWGRNRLINFADNSAMEFISVVEFAEKYGISERTARNYCASGKIEGAFLTGKTWNIPYDAILPSRKKREVKVMPLLSALREQKQMKLKGGIYHHIQIELTYNSNHIEGSRLTHDQTRYIFETHTIGITEGSLDVDDIIETSNHFRCIDMIIDRVYDRLTEKFIKELHCILKTGTSDSRKDWFAVGGYKKLPNEVGGQETSAPEDVHKEMQALLTEYNSRKRKSFDDILDFHHRFERIHPFQDGNGRVGRLVMFKECLANGHVPFIITDELKMFYYRGLREWKHIREYLRDTCLTAQDSFKERLDYFRIPY
jgi:fic family protein